MRNSDERSSRETKNNQSLAITIQKYLESLNEKIVFAESCTGGEIASTMAKIPGASQHLCGSFVSYRASSKEKWLEIDCRIINAFTTESKKVAKAMATGALSKTPEATWSLSVVGHFGPNAPEEKDGKIFICISRRTNKGKIKIKEQMEHTLSVECRETRQKMATEVCLTALARILLKRMNHKK